eukprot:4541760-Lingulodinium_polyedra.AAC.1
MSVLAARSPEVGGDERNVARELLPDQRYLVEGSARWAQGPSEKRGAFWGAPAAAPARAAFGTCPVFQ